MTRSEILRQRIRARLDALEMSPFKAAEKIGKERNFLYDLLTGKKDMIRENTLEAVANALECDVDYLLGLRSAAVTASTTDLMLAGFCELGVWYERPCTLQASNLSVGPDPRYAPEDQHLFLLRDAHAAGLDLPISTFVVVANREALTKSGRRLHQSDIVVVKRTNEFGYHEHTVRVVEDMPNGSILSLRANQQFSNLTIVEGKGVEVVGLVLRSVMDFDRR